MAKTKSRIEALFNASAKFQQEQVELAKSTYTPDERLLKLEIGNQYRLRLLFFCDPALSERKSPFIFTRTHQFYDVAKKKYSDEVICPKTAHISGPNGWKECPICQKASELYNAWKDTGDKRAKVEYNKIKANVKDYAVVYVVSDKLHPDNNGTIKIIKYGITFEKFFNSEIYGQVGKNEEEPDETYGITAFLLDDSGYDLMISVSKKTDGEKDYPEYKIKFSQKPSAVQLNEDDLPEIFEKLNFDKDFFKTTSEEALNKWFNKYVVSNTLNDTKDELDDLTDDDETSDSILFGDPKEAEPEPKAKKKVVVEDDDDLGFDDDPEPEPKAKKKVVVEDDDDLGFDDDPEPEPKAKKKVVVEDDDDADDWSF